MCIIISLFNIGIRLVVRIISVFTIESSFILVNDDGILNVIRHWISYRIMMIMQILRQLNRLHQLRVPFERFDQHLLIQPILHPWLLKDLRAGRSFSWLNPEH